MMTELEYGATQIKIERENEEKLKHYPILQKQLEIAIKCLNTYANEDYWLYCCKACGGSYYNLHRDKINLKYGEYPARDALANIKELNK